MYVMEEIQSSTDDAGSKSKSNIAKWIKSDSAVRATDLLAGAAAIGLVFLWLQYSTSAIFLGGFDGYFPINLARLPLGKLPPKTFFPPPSLFPPLTTPHSPAFSRSSLLFPSP